MMTDARSVEHLTELSMAIEHGEIDYNRFDCGATRRWRNRGCAGDPMFRTIDQYNLHVLRVRKRLAPLCAHKLLLVSALPLVSAPAERHVRKLRRHAHAR